jgi:NAD(P)-dependent dehydrogenase (short-subunit alcohol dehydrogenase family)
MTAKLGPDLSGKVTLVTGASRGIGATIARTFAEAGSHLVLAARDQTALNTLAEELRQLGVDTLVAPTDVTDPSAVESLVTQTIDTFGRLDCAVNNAGGGSTGKVSVADLTLEQYRSDMLGWTVWMAARDTDAARAAAATITDTQPDADVRVVRLDVTDDASVAQARDEVTAAGTGLDVLVNNAGIAVSTPTLETTPADFLPVFGVNVLGPVRVTHAFLPLLTLSSRPRLVMVSSGLGSIHNVNDAARSESQVPGMVYQSSKAALNMIANQYAKAMPSIRVTTVDPGYTATDLNGHTGTQTVTEGTDAIVAAATADEVAGPHIDRHGPVSV